MDFGQAISTCFKKFADINGRAQRSEYWWFFLFNLIVNIAATALFGDGLISVLITLALIVPAISVGVRRLHDTNRTGWWMLAFIIPLLGLVLALFWLTKRGTVGPNQYGDDPLGGYAGEQTYYNDIDAQNEARNNGDMFRGNNERTSESRTEERNAPREEKAPEGPWADRKPKAETPEPPKQVTEEKKRKIEPPRFGRDARKKGD
ncbi:MAG: DUF805 domain-containing protein [Lentilitoribacter sp.]